jgi:hypothetical protein
MARLLQRKGMTVAPRKKSLKRVLVTSAIILFIFFIILLIFVDRIVQPLLRDRLHTLIVQGSDSLYTYNLGRLKANFFGGNVEVQNLQISIDSSRYQYLKARNALPSLTMQLSLKRGHIKGIGIISLLFGKKIIVDEIMSSEADIRLLRHIRPGRVMVETQTLPLWKAIQPNINSIYVDRVRLNGIKLLYRNADTSESIKLQFDRCDAHFNNIRIDSASSEDSTRIAFTKEISLRFEDLKFRTPDSLYKMKAKGISYSSVARSLEIDSFKLQPTLEKEDYYKAGYKKSSLYYIGFQKVRFVNVHLDHFIHSNIIDADSVIFRRPDISIYNDKTVMDYKSKIGRYPHQLLLNAGSTIMVQNIKIDSADLEYTERNVKGTGEGRIFINNMNVTASNVTNDSIKIRQNPICVARMQGTLLGNCPFYSDFRFYLDSTDGRYDAVGKIKNITAEQLNPLAFPLANVQINSFNIRSLDFVVSGSNYEAIGNVHMRYNNLSITLKKTDEETGETKTKKFFTKILNRFIIWPDNPGPDGIERVAKNKRVARLTTQSFFGLLWKTIFAGMQDIMMKT